MWTELLRPPRTPQRKNKTKKQQQKTTTKKQKNENNKVILQRINACFFLLSILNIVS